MGAREGFAKYTSGWEALLRVGDVAAVILAGWLSAVFYLGGFPDLAVYDLGLVLTALLVLMLFPMFGLYRQWQSRSPWLEVQTLTVAWLALVATLTFVVFLTKRGPDFSRGWFTTWIGLGWLMLLAERALLRMLHRVLWRHGYNRRRIVVVRSGRLGLDVARRIASAPWTDLKVVALFNIPGGHSRQGDVAPEVGDDVAQFDDLSRLAEFVERERIDQVWIVLPLREENAIHRVLYTLRHSSVPVRYVPDVSGLRLLNHPITEVAGFPVMSLTGTHLEGLNATLKTLFDRVLALVILVLTSPL